MASLGDWKCWTDTRLQAMAGTKPHVHLHRVKQYSGKWREVAATSEPSHEMHYATMQTFVTSHMVRGRVL